MRLLCVLLLVSTEILSGSSLYIAEPYHTIDVPFHIENGGSMTQEVFLEFHSYTVLNETDVAIRMHVQAADDISLTADKCGKRLFQTSEDITTATYYFNKEWVKIMLTGIAKNCSLHNEYAVNFTIDCTGSCDANISFSIIKLDSDAFKHYSENKTYPMEGEIPFRTEGDDIPTSVSVNVGLLIEAAYENSKLRFLLETEYTTEYTMTIGKCGLEMLQFEGNPPARTHTFNWEELKLARLATYTLCPSEKLETIDYGLSSVEPGHGIVNFNMELNQPRMDGHPEKELGFIELAIGIPKPTQDVPTQSSTHISIIVISVLVVLKFIYAM